MVQPLPHNNSYLTAAVLLVGKKHVHLSLVIESIEVREWLHVYVSVPSRQMFLRGGGRGEYMSIYLVLAGIYRIYVKSEYKSISLSIWHMVEV